MTESKFKRLVVAGTVGAVLLVAILLIVMVYQLIAIAVEKNNYEEYQAAIARLEQLKDDNEQTLQYRQTEAWIVRRARELGFKYKGDISD